MNSVWKQVPYIQYNQSNDWGLNSQIVTVLHSCIPVFYNRLYIVKVNRPGSLFLSLVAIWEFTPLFGVICCKTVNYFDCVPPFSVCELRVYVYLCVRTYSLVLCRMWSRQSNPDSGVSDWSCDWTSIGQLWRGTPTRSDIVWLRPLP